MTNPDKVARIEGTSELKDELLAHFSVLGEDGKPKYLPAKEAGGGVRVAAEERGPQRHPESVGPGPTAARLTEIRPIWTRGWLPAAGARLGDLHARPDPGADHRHARLDGRGAAARLDQPEDSKRYIHHYNFPPFSVGEARRMRGPGRRDIGHGALAERALLAVVPERG